MSNQNVEKITVIGYNHKATLFPKLHWKCSSLVLDKNRKFHAFSDNS